MSDITDARQARLRTLTQIPMALLRTMRPRQWVKNGMVFVGLVFDAQMFDLQATARVAVAFVLFCLVAGTVYIINDLADLEKDRLHPRKRYRPLPAGELPVGVAVAAGVLLPLITLGIAAWFSPPLALTLLGYLLLQLAYSFWLKNVVLIDVLVIGAGFLLRVVAGVVVIEVARFSPWLYVVTGFASLFFAVGKRRQELLLLNDRAETVRPAYRNYTPALLDDMLRMVTTGTLLAYTLYTFEAHPERPFMLLTIPFALYGIMRYLYVIHVQGKGSAPDEVLLEDVPLMVTILLWGLVVVGVLYLS
ncbi:MAG: decaprenyl-phosphate phosphoribosyltransferase [Anaerolineae bacterium]|nr:decaprenyl-phosphate phosphoribosyltransferase [Anaerolineae bacterium]